MEQVRAAVNQDHRRTIHELSAEGGIGYGSCQRILTEQVNMHRIAAKFVPRVLTQDKKDSRITICQELKETVMNDALHLNVITAMNASFILTTRTQNCNGRVLGLEDPQKARIQKTN